MTRPPQVSLTSQTFQDTSLLTFPALAGLPGFAHAVTTRPWNMAVHRGPQAHLALDRLLLLCDHLGFSLDRLTAPQQVHSAHVLPVLPTDIGAGSAGSHEAVRFVDGLVCDLPGVPLMLFSADCPIIVAVHPGRRVFGAVHASWRGTVGRIAVELVRRLNREFDVAPDELLAAICPCAGPREYEVRDDVFRIAQAQLEDAERFFPTVGTRRFFDLRAANVVQLTSAGVQAERISVAQECSISDHRFFSHRRDGAETGRFALLAGFP